MTQGKQKAILAALSHNWEQALAENKAILADEPDDVDALNRLTYAYIQLGEIPKAKITCRKVLSIDRFNTIAIKNLQKIKIQHGFKRNDNNSTSIIDANFDLPSLFLEEPGVTKSVTLVNVAPKAVILNLAIGDQVNIVTKKHAMEVRAQNNIYIGAFPDDLAFRMGRMIKAGNEYITYIKSVGKNSVTVFIKEVKRAKRFHNQPTFPVVNDQSFYSYTQHGAYQLTDEERSSLDEDSDEDAEE